MSKSSSIDENRYSRQILSLGKGSQVKLNNAVIQVFNLDSHLAIEVTKNLVLQGIGGLILNGNPEKEIELKSFLEKINPSCKIYCSSVVKESKENKLESTLDIMLNKLFDTNKTMIYSRVGACRGFIFNDFKEHIIEDVDGESPSNLVIRNINFDDKGIIIVKTSEYHQLSDGDKVKFSNLEGNSLDFLKYDEFKVSTINQVTFSLVMSPFKDDDIINKYFKFVNGNVRKIKEPITISYTSLEEQLKDPTLMEDWINPKNPMKQFDYWNSNKLYPEDNLELVPVSAYFGGLIASEAIKFITNKYTPINQWYFWEDNSYLNYDESGRNPVEKIIGKDAYEKLTSSNIFMVGSGAIGCEMLKNLAGLNVSTKGKFKVTDPDTIEVSNLSRQFLFHSEDVNKHKSEVAVEKINRMYPEVKLEALTDKMSRDNEDKYDDNFYSNVDILVNALDNYQARLFMDKKAVKYQLPLFESGTQGAKGNTQPVIPHLTENYGATSDPPESESYPLCTIKNFPNKPEHVIHYVKEMFVEWCDDFPSKVNEYLKDESYLDTLSDVDRNQLITKMNLFFEYQDTSKGQMEFWNTFYYRYFRDNILQILENFPRDHQVDGEPFWSAGKKCPNEPDGSIKEDFIKSGLKISGILYKKVFDYENMEREILEPKISKTKVAVDEKDLKEQEQMEETILKVHPSSLVSIDFDKDIPEHYKWLYYACLVRAKSYHIDFPDMLKTRQISGKIIPAMATTTSMVAGLISLEILKYFQKSKLEVYRSYFLNLSLNQYLYSEPNHCKKDRYGTIWDNYEENNNLTIGSLMEKYSTKFECEISIVVSDTQIVFAPFISSEDDKNKKLSELGFGNKFTLNMSGDEEDELPPVDINLN